MDIVSNALHGFQQILQPMYFLYCFVGVFLGTVIGVLPGIGPVATISMLLPFTLTVSPLGSIIILSGVFYGAMYGGSTTSILVNMPGEAASVVTCLDGYQMARKGRAGPALGMSAFGSFIGGTFSVLVLMFLVLPLARISTRFGPPEYFAFISMGMVLVIYLSRHSFIKGAIMAVLGLLLGCVGTDLVSGKMRFVYGISQFYDGIDSAPMVMGLFGISEVMINLGGQKEREVFQTKVKNLWPTLEDWKKSALPILRGSVLGFLIGLIPGGGAILASFVSYTVEKKVSKHSEEFGNGAIEGVAGPETANNAAVGGCFVPLFALGIPSNMVMALLLATFMIHGVAPGPGFIAKNPDLFWGIICSMYLGNVLLVILNLPLIGIWVKMLKIPYRILFPLILLFCLIGAFSINGRTFDILVMIGFGLLGYFLRIHGYEPAPLALAFVLGPLFEVSFRQTMIIANQNPFFILSKPIALGGLLITMLLILSKPVSVLWKVKSGPGRNGEAREAARGGIPFRESRGGTNSKEMVSENQEGES